MKCIVVMDNNNAIGREGKLLTRLPKDLKRFKKFTEGNVVIMGRKTLESLPGGKPLEGRVTIVLTRDPEFFHESVIVLNSIEELLGAYSTCRILEPECEFFICGGGEIYKQLLPNTHEIIITRINSEFEDADTFFPDFQKDFGWELTGEEYNIEDGDYKTDYITYTRR